MTIFDYNETKGVITYVIFGKLFIRFKKNKEGELARRQWEMLKS